MSVGYPDWRTGVQRRSPVLQKATGTANQVVNLPPIDVSEFDWLIFGSSGSNLAVQGSLLWYADLATTLYVDTGNMSLPSGVFNSGIGVVSVRGPVVQTGLTFGNGIGSETVVMLGGVGPYPVGASMFGTYSTLAVNMNLAANTAEPLPTPNVAFGWATLWVESSAEPVTAQFYNNGNSGNTYFLKVNVPAGGSVVQNLVWPNVPTVGTVLNTGAAATVVNATLTVANAIQ